MSVRSRRSAQAERYPAAGLWTRETLAERFERVVAERAGLAAISEGGRRFTYREVAGLVGSLAGRLAGLGVRPGDVVSWQLPNWWEAVVVHHAALRIGAIPNPLNPIFRARELRFVLAEARPRVLVVPRRFRGHDYAGTALRVREAAPSLEHVVSVRGEVAGCLSFEDLASGTGDAPLAGAAADVALLMYTSGTSGDPKGVQHSHQTLLYEIESLRDVHRITPDDRYLGGSPVAHVAGLVYGVLMPFALGTRTAFLARWDPGRALELIERERATFGTGAPTFLKTLAEHPDVARRDLGSFRLFSTGGATISAEMVRAAGNRLGCVVKRAYGSTEAPTLTATSLDDPEDARVETDGRAIGAAEVRIVRPDGALAPGGEEGEIRARSPEVFLGYRNPELDAGCFTEDGWYRTGDLGSLDAGGYLRVSGRIADIIIRGGENLSAKEIEDLLGEHPAVLEAAVVGVPDPVLGERACAFVVPRRGRTFTFREMVAFLASREIARQKIPERLEVRSRLPRTASGKVRKQDLSSGEAR